MTEENDEDYRTNFRNMVEREQVPLFSSAGVNESIQPPQTDEQALAIVGSINRIRVQSAEQTLRMKNDMKLDPNIDFLTDQQMSETEEYLSNHFLKLGYNQEQCERLMLNGYNKVKIISIIQNLYLPHFHNLFQFFELKVI